MAQRVDGSKEKGKKTTKQNKTIQIRELFNNSNSVKEKWNCAFCHDDDDDSRIMMIIMVMIMMMMIMIVKITATITTTTTAAAAAALSILQVSFSLRGDLLRQH